jgi:integrase
MFETLGKSDSPKARRDQAILRLLFDLGLRRESIVSLDLQHWSDESRTLQSHAQGPFAAYAEETPSSDRRCAQEMDRDSRGPRTGLSSFGSIAGGHCDRTGSPEMAFTT